MGRDERGGLNEIDCAHLKNSRILLILFSRSMRAGRLRQ